MLCRWSCGFVEQEFLEERNVHSVHSKRLVRALEDFWIGEGMLGYHPFLSGHYPDNPLMDDATYSPVLISISP